MNNNKSYIKENLNNITFYMLKEFLMGSALIIPIANMINNKINWSNVLKNILNVIFFRDFEYNFTKMRTNKVMFFYSHEYVNRRDHMDLFQKVCSTTSKKNIVVGRKFNRKLELKNVQYVLLVPIWICQMRKLKIKFMHKIYIIVFLLEAVKWTKQIQKNNHMLSSQQLLITLFDANMYENLLVQFLKIKGVPTATLQHGHFVKEKKVSVAFDGFVSDSFLVWGQYTKEQALKSGISSNKILKVGCPKFIGYDSKSANKQLHIFGVVLDGGGEESLEANIEMIKIANEFAELKKMKYVLKLHPISNINDFKDAINTEYLHRLAKTDESITDFAKTVDFTLAMGSSVYSELLFLKKIVFRYISLGKDDRYKEIGWGTIKDTEELLSLFEEYILNPDLMYKNVQKNSAYLFEEGDIFQNYQKTIFKLSDINVEKRIQYE